MWVQLPPPPLHRIYVLCQSPVTGSSKFPSSEKRLPGILFTPFASVRRIIFSQMKKEKLFGHPTIETLVIVAVLGVAVFVAVFYVVFSP